ncbi:MAG: hypothetical protein ACFE94_00670 [Candidatus Hodarchaeota archaeon]
MKITKIEFNRQANFIVTLLLIHFIFFGYICNRYRKSIGEDILYLHKILFNPYSIVSLVILFIIVFIMAFREDFFEYGIRNSIWLTPFILAQSWFWYIFVNYKLDILIQIGRFFINYEGYITIFSVLGINLLAAILAVYSKQKYIEHFRKIEEIEG